MFCPWCGTRNFEDASFCMRCGRALPRMGPPTPPAPFKPVALPPGAHIPQPPPRAASRREAARSKLRVALLLLTMFGIGVGGASAFFFAPWREWFSSSGPASNVPSPSGDDRVPVPKGPVRIVVPASLADVGQVIHGVSTDPATLPAPAVNRAKLIGAGNFEPDGIPLPDGVAVTWPLAYKRWPGSPLFIASWDPAKKQWIGSGEEAVVSDTGTTATGLVRHFSQQAVTDRRVGGYHYETEWVFILASYERDLDLLARDLSTAMSAASNIPGLNITAEQWLQQQPIVVGDKTLDSNCLAAGRAFFASRKKRLDDAFADVFGRWSKATERSNAQSVVALWEAVRDLRHLGEERGPNWQSKAFVWAREQAAEAALDKSVDAVKHLTEKYSGMKVPDGLWDAAKTLPKKEVKAAFETIFKNPNAAECTDLAETLSSLADTQLFDLIYSTRPGNPQGPAMPGTDPQLNTDFYALSGLETRTFNFKSSMGLEFAKEDYLDRKATSFPWILGDGRTRYLNDDQLEGKAEAVAQIPNYGFFTTKDPKKAGNFLQVQEQYRAWKRGFNAELETHEKYWFDLQARAKAPNASDRDRLLALGAIRVLRADLARYVKEDSLPRYIKAFATKQLAKSVAKLVPLAAIGPIGALWEELITTAVDAGAEKIAPDLLAKFVIDLQTASERAAAQVNIDSNIPARFPQGEHGILELLDVGRVKLPPVACGNQPPASTSVGCETGKPPTWNVLAGKSRVDPSGPIMCNACGPGGAGTAVNLEFACPAATNAAWQSKTGSRRSSEVSRTDTSVMTRENRSVTGFCGTGSMAEKLFVKIDNRSIATIYTIKNSPGGHEPLVDWAKAMAAASPARAGLQCPP